jgi:hypothetical protein
MNVGEFARAHADLLNSNSILMSLAPLTLARMSCLISVRREQRCTPARAGRHRAAVISAYRLNSR